jgi:hypothetical protein
VTIAFAADGRINVRHNGARGNGVADDAAAIQTCLNAGRTHGRPVYLPAGSYRVNSTLTYGTAGAQSYYRVEGDGPLLSKLTWGGSSAAYPLLRVEGMFLAGVHDLGFYGPGADTVTPVGQTIGLWLANSTGSGSGQNGNSFRNLLFDGFYRGVQAGDVATQRSASELLFLGLRAQNCDTGVRLLDSNTLDIYFHNLQSSRCRVGLDAGQCGQVGVFGGSSSYNAIDFLFATGGTFGLYNYRSEHATQHHLYVPATNTRGPTRVAVTGANVSSVETGGGDFGAGTGGTGGGFAVAAFGAAELHLTGCHLEGKVGVANYYSRPLVAMAGCTVRDTQPFRFYFGTDFSQHGDRTLENVRYRVAGCSRMNAADPFWVDDGSNRPAASSFFPDSAGTLTAQDTGPPV